MFTGLPATSDTTGYPNVVYHCAIDGGALSHTSIATSCLKSLDGGLIWVRTGAPAYTNDPRPGGGQIVPGHCAGGTGHGYVDNKGVVYLPRGWCGQPYLAISRDEGTTWERVQVARNGMPSSTLEGTEITEVEEHEAAVVVDRSGNIYYFWMARDRLPYLAISRDGGKLWTKPKMVGFPGLKEAWGPTMALGATGKIAMAYVGSTTAPGGKRPTGFGGRYTKSEWNGYIAMSTNALSSRPVVYTGAVNDPKEPLIRGDCAIVRCGAQFDFIDVVITPSGAPVAAFIDGCPRGTKGRCGDGTDDQTAIGVGILGRLDGGPRLR